MRQRCKKGDHLDPCKKGQPLRPFKKGMMEAGLTGEIPKTPVKEETIADEEDEEEDAEIVFFYFQKTPALPLVSVQIHVFWVATSYRSAVGIRILV